VGRARCGDLVGVGRGARDPRDRLAVRVAVAAVVRIGAGAGVAVGAGRAARLRRIGAGAGLRITCAGVMALVGGGARDRVAGADAALAAIALRARVAVVARRAVGLRRRDAALRKTVGRARPGIARIVQRGAVTVLRAEDRFDALGRRGARR